MTQRRALDCRPAGGVLANDLQLEKSAGKKQTSTHYAARYGRVPVKSESVDNRLIDKMR